MKTGITAITFGEMTAMCKALSYSLGKDWVDEHARPAVIATMAAFYRTRYGPAAGSTAIQKQTGRTATRYYDNDFKKLRWLVLTNAEKGKVEAERVDSLDGNGSLAWTINERSWEELVYR